MPIAYTLPLSTQLLIDIGRSWAPMEVTINSRFRDLIPPPSVEELASLEASLVSEGCRDAVVVWLNEGSAVLVDGHNRHSICKRLNLAYQVKEVAFANEDAACVWIIRNQFARRNLTTFARAELALKLEPLIKAKAQEKEHERKTTLPKSAKSSAPPIDARAEVAKAAGVSGDTITKTKFVLANADEETKVKLRSQPDMKIHRVHKEIKEKQQRETRQEKRTEAAKGAAPDVRIIVGDFREHADKVASNSLSLIFTDPPYDRNASKMLPDLAKFAADKLADGGSLVCYVGQTQIPAALDAFRLHLRYWWTIACVHAGRATAMREYGINAGWKAVLWFVKGTRDNNSVFVSDVMSGGEEKTHHDWQQAESEASYWIEKLCPIDGIVCDPFLGGGTTAAAAEKLKRKWIGFEIEQANASIAGKRVAG